MAYRSHQRKHTALLQTLANRLGATAPFHTQGFGMKIKITTDRKPWVNGSKANKGDVVEVTAAEAKAMIGNGFAEEVKAAPKKHGRPKKND